MARFSFLLTLTFIFLTNGLFAQSFQMNKQIKGLDLPSRIVENIGQDPMGRMWFSTARGIFYSDGVNTFGLPDNIANNLGERPGMKIDMDGVVYVYGKRNGTKSYALKDGIWKTITFPDSIAAPGKGELFFEVIGSGDDKRMVLSKGGMLAVSKLGSGKWDERTYSLEEWGLLKSVYYSPQDGCLLLFKQQAVRYEIKEGLSPVPMQVGSGSRPVWKVVFNRSDSLYYFLGNDFFASGKSLYKAEKLLDQGIGKLSQASERNFGLDVRRGDVYYFFDSQLHKFNPEMGETIEISTFDHLKSYYINTAYIDRENIIWIGTVRGVVNLPTLRFQNYDKWYGLMEEEVSAIINLGESENIYGFNNGIQYWKGGKLILESHGGGEPGEPVNRVTNFHKDKNGVVWIASAVRGLGRLETDKRKVKFYPAPEEDFVMHVSTKGDSLFTIVGNKIYLADIQATGDAYFERDITDSIFNQVLKLPVKPIRKLAYEIGHGRMVIAGSWPELKDSVVLEDDVMAFSGYDWELQENGEYLLATKEGLKVLQPGSRNLVDFVLNGQQVTRPVYALLRDEKGNVWAGTDDGVAIIGNGAIRFFNEHNGLAGNEINRGAFSMGVHGRVLIGTQNGLSVFIPEEDQLSFAAPKVAVNSMNILGVEDNTSLERIPYEHNNVEFDFSAISFLQMTNFTVSYKLEGLHDDWQHIQNPRTSKLQFSSLPPGDYQLMLKASLGGQFSSDIAYSSVFSIIKPTYLQSWFIGLVIMFFLMLGFGLNVLISQFKERGVLQKSIDEKNQEIKTAEDQFRNVWDSSQDGLILSNLEGQLIAANPAMIKLAGTNKERTGRNVHVKHFFREESFFYKNKDDIIRALSSPSKGSSFEAVMPFHSGDKNIDLFVTRVNSDKGQEDVIMMVFRDVTNKKIYEAGLKEAKEKAEEANRIKTNFLSNMSHEIRTPLNGIMGSTENIIYQNKDNPALVGQLEIIMESGERLLNTINSILDMAKIEANKMEISYEEVNVNDFLSNLLIPLKTLAIRKKLLLTARFETKPFIARLDKRYFEMIVNNIVGNAIKYSDEGLIRVKLKREDGNLCLEVKDMGIGMSEEFIAKIYSPFEQESGGYNRQFEGTGLGLSITKNLIGLLGGEIKISSKKNEGTTVWVILPVT